MNLAAHPVGWPLARLSARLGCTIAVPGFGLVVNDAEIAHEILVRDDDFPKNGPGSLSATLTAMIGPDALSNMDGDAHRRLRGMLTDLVAPAQARSLLAGCDDAIAGMTRALESGATLDLVRWMRALSGRITFDMLGVAPPGDDPESSCLALAELGETITRGLDFRTPSAARLDEAVRGCATITSWAKRGWESPDTPTGSFVRRLRDNGFTFEEARGVIGIVFLAGTLTTAAALPRIVALLVDARRVPALRNRPELLGKAIDEGMRFSAPVPATVRICARDTTVAGRRVRRDTRIVLFTINAARDPRLFPSPNRFDPTRTHDPRARNLWFGAGAHFCLGFAVAQQQLRAVLGALAALDGDLEIMSRRRARGVMVPAYARLDVRLKGMRS